jgi:hypothetical protein
MGSAAGGDAGTVAAGFVGLTAGLGLALAAAVGLGTAGRLGPAIASEDEQPAGDPAGKRPNDGPTRAACRQRAGEAVER